MLNDTERRRLYQRAPSALREATVQDPPLTEDGWMRVELDDAPGVIHECPWPPADGSEPVGGDAAAVMESDGGNFWAVAWWSQSGAVAPVGVVAHVIQENGVALVARAALNFGAGLTASDNPGSSRTDVVAEVTLAQRNAPNGYAGLDGTGKLLTSTLPALSITSITPVASQAAMLALTAQEGDVAVRSDNSTTWIKNAGTAGTIADWTQLATPANLVLSVAGKTGAVTLVKGDVGLGNVDNTSDVNKPVSTAQQTALNLKQNVAGAAAARCSIATGGTQTIATGTTAAITFASEDYDTDNIHSTAANTSRMTPTTPGTYVINGHVQGAVAPAAGAQVQLRVTLAAGGTVILDSRSFTGSDYVSAAGQWKFLAGDYVELLVSNASGGTITAFRAALAVAISR